MGKYFGTDGFRGEANVVLTVEHAFKVGRFLGWYYGQEHKARVVVTCKRYTSAPDAVSPADRASSNI